MKPLLSIIILCFLILGCESQDHKNERNKNVVQEVKIDSIKNELTEVPTQSVASHIPECTCEAEKRDISYSTDLSFQDTERARSKNEALFNKWSQDSLVKKVTSIGFSEFDTIPAKYSIFENVERLSIHSADEIYGLDIFPKLKTIDFFASVINLDTDEKWLSQLEILSAQKTKFLGLESFREVPSLRIIHMRYSGFEVFPQELGALACIHELTLDNYLFGEIDLSNIDLSRNACLKKVVFHTWHDMLSGIPAGISESNIEELRVSHQKLTAAEKRELERIVSPKSTTVIK